MPISSRFVVRSTIGLLAIGFLTLFGIVGMTIWLGERAQSYFNDVIDARDLRGSAVELRDAVRTAEASQRGYLLTGNEIYLAPYDSAKALALRHLEMLDRKLGANGESAPMQRRLAAVIREKADEMDRSIALKTEGRDAEADALIRTNRGKALMDEANVFLAAIILTADEKLTTGVSEQRTNAQLLRWVSIFGAIAIILVVGVVTFTILLHAREIAQARDEVRLVNAGLEERVKRRTADLDQARERAEVLLSEVNHRVANSLTLVAALVRLQARSASEQAAKDALSDVQARIQAISLIHKRLYSAGDARFVALDEYLKSLLDQLETSMRAEGLGTRLRYEIAPAKLTTDASVSLGVIVTEWVTNAFKYAYPEQTGEVRVKLTNGSPGRAELIVEDDGVGRAGEGPAKGTGLGTRIVQSMASSMNAEITQVPQAAGTAMRLSFPIATE